MKNYDIAIIGGGPAGYTAAIYAGRAGHSSVVLEKNGPGGQMAVTSSIENYPGFDIVDGFELAYKMKSQAEAFGAVSVIGEVTRASLDGEEKVLTTSTGEEISARAVIVATGASPRPLGVPGEEEYKGRGVSYCATCDGMFFRKKTVAVVGGGDTAFEDALYLSNICEKVYVIHRRDKFRAAQRNVEKAKAKENVEFVLNAVPVEIAGEDGKVCGIKIRDTASGEEKTLDCAGVFVAVGRAPDTAVFEGLLELDKSGYIVADESCKTSVPGVFVAGDVRTKDLRQIVTACADGAMAVHSAEEWLS